MTCKGLISSFGYGYTDSNLIETLTVTADHGTEPYGVLKELTVNALNQVTEWKNMRVTH